MGTVWTNSVPPAMLQFRYSRWQQKAPSAPMATYGVRPRSLPVLQIGRRKSVFFACALFYLLLYIHSRPISSVSSQLSQHVVALPHCCSLRQWFGHVSAAAAKRCYLRPHPPKPYGDCRRAETPAGPWTIPMIKSGTRRRPRRPCPPSRGRCRWAGSVTPHGSCKICSMRRGGVRFAGTTLSCWCDRRQEGSAAASEGPRGDGPAGGQVVQCVFFVFHVDAYVRV